MSLTWNGADPPEVRAPRPLEWVRLALRGAVMLFATYFGIIFVVAFNIIERALRLGVADRIVCLWGAICLALCGLRLERRGAPMSHDGIVVSNHIGWIDIFTLMKADHVFFVSKAEVAKWPVVGILSRQIGTMYIERNRTQAKRQEALLAARLRRGDRLCFFPEGTSTDGQRVLAFRTSLFAAVLSPEMRDRLWVQPVSVVYHPPPGLPRDLYGWWGTMPLGSHVRSILALSVGGVAEVIHHPPLRAADFDDRKALGAACEAAVREGVETALAERAGKT